ncbi:hypothetical protein [Bacillus sp. 03113]|uniref:hypothetical protein n=1 Tax=Bacillus sp. 03113 TaxID=2578211 RepID=UPI0015E8E5E1|nr:hypothetical protein [Bacillus sp. 03113]
MKKQIIVQANAKRSFLTATIALDKHANGLTSGYQGRREQKKTYQISPWFFPF